MPADTYARNVYVTKDSNLLQGVILYCLDDSNPADPKSKLLVYKQASLTEGSYSWTRDTTSTLDGLLMNDVQPMLLDINGD